jgi:hypothetical protein
MSAQRFTIDDIHELEARIDELERALAPFANAAEGFSDGSIILEYRESDGDYYTVFYDNKDGVFELSVAELLLAKRIYNNE